MPNQIKILCLQCGSETNHIMRIKYEHSWNTESSVGTSTYQIVQCAGCDTVSYRSVTEGSDYYNNYTQEMEPVVELYPRRHATSRQAKYFWNAPEKLRKLYREVIDAFNADMPVLCAGGLRALVEGIALDKGVLGGDVPKDMTDSTAGTIFRDNLQGKIAGMAQKSLLSPRHADMLHDHRFLGNDALHELKRPTAESLEAAIDVIEHTMENIYELPQKRRHSR
jgi:hypothetical protein